MSHSLHGIRQIKESIEINASREICYQYWVNQSQFPEYMSKILRFETTLTPVVTLQSPQSIQAAVNQFGPQIFPMERVKHWLVSGPGGKLYEFENKVILDIPGKFYSTTSTDPDDLCTQASLLFNDTETPGVTLVELKVSFWESSNIKNGKATQLAYDILQEEDSFFSDCLKDFKAHVEKKTVEKMTATTQDSSPPNKATTIPLPELL